MHRAHTQRILSLSIALAASLSAMAEDRTSFQTAAPYRASVDIASDQVMIYGVNDSFEERVRGWKAQGYHLGFMTGISWGNYDTYYGALEARQEEIQTDASGKRFMHGNSATVGYNVPTPAYLDFLNEHINPAVDAGIDSFYLEEPEYWAATGWSEGFKRAWQDYYGEAWQAPDSSVAAQFKASRLKYELYFNALGEVFRHIKSRARAQGRDVKCYVPTHSLINYAHWRIVSPESHLMDLQVADGYIAQVWTGTARTPNVYQGRRKERTFETAFLEYGQMLSMVRPTGRTVWFLADPVEDDPRHTWSDYECNYKLTLTASLFWPEVDQFEVMPWPDRIFDGKYPLQEGGGERGGIPQDYAVSLLTSINALNDMQQPDDEFDCGTQGIGVLVSDTLMFQRANPEASDPDLAPVHALALPLLKQGVPVHPVQLETVLEPATLPSYQVLFLTYEGQKPLRAAYHDALVQWVKDGGALILVGDGADPYHAVPEWWNEQGATDTTPYQDLLTRLELTEDAPRAKMVAAGKGFVRILAQSPASLQNAPEGGEVIRSLAREALEAQGRKLKLQNYLSLRRGPYRIAMGLDESTGESAHELQGPFINLFDPQLSVVDRNVLVPGAPALLYDLNWSKEHLSGPRVLAGSARIRDQHVEEDKFSFSTRGPAGTTARIVLQLETEPESPVLEPPIPFTATWDNSHSLLRISFENQAQTIRVAVPIHDRVGSRVAGLKIRQ